MHLKQQKPSKRWKDWCFLKKYSDFSKENLFFSKKIATGFKYALKCNWNFESSQNVQIWIFLNKTDGFFEKKMKNLKITKGSKVGVECNWISKISQNIRKLAFVWKKKRFFLRKKILRFQRPLRAANLS